MSRTNDHPNLLDFDVAFNRFLVDRALRLSQPEPLATARRPTRPAVYVLHYRGSEFLPYTQLQGPIYVGSETSARLNRLNEHCASLRAVENLNLNSFYVQLLETTSPSVALAAEAIAIEMLDPLWNALGGFGAKPCGRHRKHHKASRFDSLHPGRMHNSQVEPHDVQELHALIAAHLERASARERVTRLGDAESLRT